MQITLSANQSDSNIASEGAPEYRTPFNTCYAMQLQISSLARNVPAVAHGPTVPVHRSVTDIPHHRPPAPNLSELAVLSCLKVHYRIASSVHTLLTCYLVVFTACVMPSVDSIRCESHAATQDVFQPVLAPIFFKVIFINSNTHHLHHALIVSHLCEQNHKQNY